MAQQESTRVWVRAGDMDTYHDFGTIEEATEYIHECIHGPDFGDQESLRPHNDIERAVRALEGIVIPSAGYGGYNGISFYWGDADANLTAKITDAELDQLRTLLG